MSKKYGYCLGFAPFLLAIACADDSSSGSPSASVAMAPAAAPSTDDNGMSGTGTPTSQQVPPADTTAPGESPTGDLGGVLLDESAASSGPTAPEDGGRATDAGSTGSAGAAGKGTFPSDVTRPRIMIVGDSISAGPGCYKKFLLAELNAHGYSNFDFVGEYTDDCGGGVMHSARSCTTALDYTQPTFMLRAECGGGTYPGLAALMVEHAPDLLMLQLGVNDVWNGQTTDAILANYSTLLAQARAENPNIVIAVAEIQQIRPTGADAEAVFARAQQLVGAVPAWANTVSQESSPVFVADLWANSDTAETLDGVHPNDAGAERMGHNWFEALQNILPPD